MAFWTNKNINIKQKHKFIVSIGEFLIPTVLSCDKPKVQIEKHEYTMINQVYRYPGIAKWQPITINFIDGSGDSGKEKVPYINRSFDPETGATGDSMGFVSPPVAGVDNLDAAQMLNNILLRSGYANPRRGRDGSTTKAAMMDNSFGGVVRIEQIESDGNTVSEGWRLYNPIVTEISWGSLDYNSVDAVEYSITIEYDYAEMYIAENKASKGYYTLDPKTSLRKVSAERKANLERARNGGFTDDEAAFSQEARENAASDMRALQTQLEDDEAARAARLAAGTATAEDLLSEPF